jgi:hypothetical protein
MPCKSVVGDLINFRGLVYSPVNEQGVVFLFGKIAGDLNMYVEEIKQGFPDCIARRFVGIGWERICIEFEYCSSNFQQHGHDPTQADLIVCWEHDWQDCPLEVIALKDILETLPNEPVTRPGTSDKIQPTDIKLEDHYSRRKMTDKAIAMFEEFQRKVSDVDDRVWKKVAKSTITFYSPSRVFCYVAFRKHGFELSFFTRGDTIDGVTPESKNPKCIMDPEIWTVLGGKNKLESVV